MARMLELAEQHRDIGMFRVPLPGNHTPIFIGNVSLAAETIDESKYEKVLEGPLVPIRDFAGDGLFTAHSDEPNWHRAHRILSPGFSTTSLEHYYPAMTRSLTALLTHWRACDRAGGRGGGHDQAHARHHLAGGIRLPL
jgi:cytochrome P450/NADPH-cytochrome P450 reductase